MSTTKLRTAQKSTLAWLVLCHAPRTLPLPPRTTRRYVAVYTTLNGVMLNADRRGHQNYSNVYWKRAPPAGANTDTSDFFIKIRYMVSS